MASSGHTFLCSLHSVIGSTRSPPPPDRGGGGGGGWREGNQGRISE